MKKLPLVLLLALASCTVGPSPLDCVDTTIGGVGVLLQPTRPTVQVPNQIVRWSPSRADLLDDRISDYPLTLTSHRQHSVFGFLPLVEGTFDGSVWDAKQVYDCEVNTPYEYSSRLEGCSIRFAPTAKCGIIEVVYEGGEGNLVRLRSLNGDGSFEAVSDTEISGCENFAGMEAYCFIRFDKPFTDAATSPDGRHLTVRIPDGRVTVKYGISYIDADQARANLDAEIPGFDFEAVSGAARGSWEEALGQIEVSGGSERDLKIFYTSLYRCRERMVDITEQGRYYSAFDHQVHETSRPFYSDNWLWDTHISLEPLITILDPEMEQDKLQSYVEMYRQSGEMPSFAVIWGNYAAMTGNYAAVWFADSRAKGLTDFDFETAYEGCRANSLDATLLPWRNGPKCELDDFYNENGWYPALHPGEQETVEAVSLPWERRQAVSLSTAFSYADWANARMARELGRAEDEALFMERAQFYKNVYRPEKGLFWPKDKDGNWIDDGEDPRYMDRAYFTENNAYTFQWDVKHDLEGLFALMGGRQEAEKKLDDLFRIQMGMAKFEYLVKIPDSTGMVGQFAMGNEPGFHIPYIYDYLGAPWKTQKRIHQLIDLLFAPTVSGIPGDEDGGGMSSFLVFSMMGFFPVTPGVPVYAIGSPFFDSVTINLPNGRKFTVKAPGASEGRKYIRSARLGGKPLERAWFTHDELLEGGVLELEMSGTPCKTWGADNLPPSALDFDINKLVR